MFSTKKNVVKFDRKLLSRRANKLTFPAIVTGLAISVFAAIITWPAVSHPQIQAITETSQTVTAASYQIYVAPTETARHTTHRGDGTLFKCTVTSVYDGDGPIHCREGASIRLNAVAAREMDGSCRPGQPCPSASALDAKRELQSIVLGHVLRCEQTGTSYNRVTAICWTESGLEVNCAMVRSGKALLWDRYNRQHSICG